VTSHSWMDVFASTPSSKAMASWRPSGEKASPYFTQPGTGQRASSVSRLTLPAVMVAAGMGTAVPGWLGAGTAGLQAVRSSSKPPTLAARRDSGRERLRVMLVIDHCLYE